MDDLKLCVCKDISLKDVLEYINKGYKTIEDIQKVLPVGEVCSMCLYSENDPCGERPVHLDKLLKSIKR